MIGRRGYLVLALIIALTAAACGVLSVSTFRTERFLTLQIGKEAPGLSHQQPTCRIGSLMLRRGSVHLVWFRTFYPYDPRALGFWSRPIVPWWTQRDVDVLGFRAWHSPDAQAAGIPLVPIAVALSWGARVAWRRSRRPQPEMCQTCGYDLRATPERCPECGAFPSRVDHGKRERPSPAV